LIGKIIKMTDLKKSHNGGHYRMAFFKMDTGKSAMTFIYSSCGNSLRWLKIKDDISKDKDIWLKGLVWLDEKKRIIDADSYFERTDNCATG